MDSVVNAICQWIKNSVGKKTGMFSIQIDTIEDTGITDIASVILY